MELILITFTRLIPFPMNFKTVFVIYLPDSSLWWEYMTYWSSQNDVFKKIFETFLISPSKLFFTNIIKTKYLFIRWFVLNGLRNYRTKLKNSPAVESLINRCIVFDTFNKRQKRTEIYDLVNKLADAKGFLNSP